MGPDAFETGVKMVPETDGVKGLWTVLKSRSHGRRDPAAYFKLIDERLLTTQFILIDNCEKRTVFNKVSNYTY